MYNIKYVRSDGKELEMNIDTGYTITTMDGVTGHSTTVSTAQGYEQLGETVLGMATSGKQIGIYGYILDQQTEKKKALLRMFLPNTYGKLVWENKYFIDVYVVNAPTISQTRHSSFSMSLFAPNPMWQDEAQSFYQLGGITGGFTFPVNYATPHSFGTTTAQTQFNAKNDGDMAAAFSLKIVAGSGGLSNFGLQNVHTLKSINFTGTLNANEWLDVYRDAGQLYVRKNGAADAFDMLDDDSTLFELDAGDNVLLFTADSGASGATVFVTFNAAFSGVLADGV